MYGLVMMRFVDAIALLMLGFAFMLLFSRKMYANVKYLTVQAVLLALLAFSTGAATGHDELYVAAVLTLLIKAYLIPRYLTKIISSTERLRETSLFLSLRLTLVIAFVLVLIAYHFAGPLALTAKVSGRDVIPVALSLTLLGMLMMVARKKVISHIIGLIEMENGIYLSAVAVAGGMPMVVEFGVFFDLLVAVIIMATFSQKIGRTFASLDTDYLRNLKG